MIDLDQLDGRRQSALTVPSELTPSGDYSPGWSRDGASLLLSGVQVPLDGDAPTPFPDDRTFFGVDGSDLRRLVDAIDWADLQPQGRPS